MFKSPWEKAAKNTASDWMEATQSAYSRLSLMQAVERQQTFCWICNTKIRDDQEGMFYPHAPTCAWDKEVSGRN